MTVSGKKRGSPSSYFQKGNKLGKGRKPGSRNKHNVILAEAIQRALDGETVQKLMTSAVDQAMNGSPELLGLLMRYGFSEMPRKTEVSGAEGGDIVMKVEIRD